jgi:hypothetical protein
MDATLARMWLSADWEERASEILDAGALPPAPAQPLAPGARHPLAFDRDGDLGAISFAVVDLHPRIARGMWCVALIYARGRGGRWTSIGEHDNVTSPCPFERPRSAEHSEESWIDWHSNDGLRQGGTYEYLTGFFGIAPLTTARLTVTAQSGTERDLRITPESGAYVAAVPAAAWTLTGYGMDGERLGALTVDHRGRG